MASIRSIAAVVALLMAQGTAQAQARAPDTEAERPPLAEIELDPLHTDESAAGRADVLEPDEPHGLSLRTRRLRRAGWVLFGLGIPAVVTGAVLVGSPECGDFCFGRVVGGIVALGIGLPAAIAGLVTALAGESRREREVARRRSEPE